MRRRKAATVRVRMPSRGLVTRLPGESADLMRSGDRNRVATAASNVRFAQGVAKSAPGYRSVRFANSLSEHCIAHWRFEEASGPRRNSLGGSYLIPVPIGDRKPGQAEGMFGSMAAKFEAENNRTSLAAYDDRLARLSDGSYTIGAWFKFGSETTEAVDFLRCSLLRLDQVGTAIKLSVSLESTTPEYTHTSPIVVGQWHYIAASYDKLSGNAALAIDGVLEAFQVGALPAGYTGSGVNIHVGNWTDLTVDSMTVWDEALGSTALEALYNNGDGLDYPFGGGGVLGIWEGNLIGAAQSKPLLAATASGLHLVERGFTEASGDFVATLSQLFAGQRPAAGKPWHGTSFLNRMILAQGDNIVQTWLPGAVQSTVLPGLPETQQYWDGVESFQGHVLLWKDDVLKWSDLNDFSCYLPVGYTAASVALTTSAGFVQPAAYQTVTVPVTTNPVEAGLLAGMWLRAEHMVAEVTYYDFWTVSSMTESSVTLEPVLLTGRTPAGAGVPTALQLFSVDANEAGEMRVVGANYNGPVVRVVAQGDYAFIFKARSILSMQYTGAGTGVFFIHPEITEEGLASPNALVSLGDGRMIFLGQNDLYAYKGGQALASVCPQFTTQLFAELDRRKIDRVLMHHNAPDCEIWLAYPCRGGGSKVLIWNYEEDTASIDEYVPDLHTVTAACDTVWQTSPSWDSFEGATWETIDPALCWDDVQGSTDDNVKLIAFGSGELVAWGRNLTARDGLGYRCFWETQDFDFGDPDVWKYVDTVVVGLDVPDPVPEERRLYVSVGTKQSFDGPITWTPRVAVNANGNATPPVKVHPGGAGRYIRLRFESEDPNSKWAVSSFEIHARAGGLY